MAQFRGSIVVLMRTLQFSGRKNVGLLKLSHWFSILTAVKIDRNQQNREYTYQTLGDIDD